MCDTTRTLVYNLQTLHYSHDATYKMRLLQNICKTHLTEFRGYTKQGM